MKTGMVLVVLVVLIGAVPALAQDFAPENYIPADFAGFVQMQVGANVQLNVAASTAAALQPMRFDLNTFQGYDSLFQLTMLDVEGITFSSTILPWAEGQITVAYHRFDDNFAVPANEVLVLVPTANIMNAAAVLGPIIQSQDLPDREMHRGVTIYIGDKSAIALVPEAVLMGPTALIKAALDVRAGAGKRLVDLPGYDVIRTASSGEHLVFAYLRGDAVKPGLSLLLNGDLSAEPLLQAMGETLRQLHPDTLNFETALLTDALDSVGIHVTVVTLPVVQGIGVVRAARDEPVITLQASATFFTGDHTYPAASDAFDATVLEMIPQNAMIVQRGENFRSTVYDMLAALPLSSFSGSVLGAFSLDSQATPTPNPTPSAQDLQEAVSGFLSILNNVGGFDLDGDLLAHFSGSYAVALLPRPNNPAPALATPFDVLLLAKVDNGQAALNGLTRLAEIITAVDQFEPELIQDFPFNTLRQAETDDVIVRLGIIDDTLVLATGSALELALDARRGDNRLIERARWQITNRDDMPQLFVDLNTLFSTFLSSPGGSISTQEQLLTASGQFLSGNLYQLKATVTLPGS